ncbi:hypothetical protein G6O69_03600 [Pseudenhygromyxa sp. WMMC2535]|uniref:hypothetical protein n=1 Tax=Pseudenhygromyxa sp. WMMC2535 TaxID=2712867 RepID=UPI001553B25C|nr:hypothetical protein [Pseudenhygromyxa sp. WMMC2535]NVB36900.1 hypothetical protein [Pseudenhygromyxa sp. WMMC2535]
MRLLKIVLAHVAVFGIAAAVASSCTVNYPTTAFRCSPAGASPNCPTQGGEEYQCCSDDPAAIKLGDLAAEVTPRYTGRDGEGSPIFSGVNNPISRSGMCIKSGSVPAAGALADVNASGCPVPCNPTWDSGDVDDICGEGSICCQTVELEADDCVLDPDIGDAGCWRPATGNDIVDLGGLEVTSWTANEHSTNQDPGGVGCRTFAEGVGSDVLEANGITEDNLKAACFRRLTVGNQRGFCLGGTGVNACPLAQSSYRDACEQMNDAQARSGCG